VTRPGDGVIRLYMTMSLDGSVAGPQDSVDAPMGVGDSASSTGSTGVPTPDRTGRCTAS
jgi:hypothetical protein